MLMRGAESELHEALRFVTVAHSNHSSFDCSTVENKRSKSRLRS